MSQSRQSRRRVDGRRARPSARRAPSTSAWPTRSRHHDKLYHEKDAPEISDADYDKLRQRLKAIEARFPQLVDLFSPTQRVAPTPTTAFAKVRHAPADAVARQRLHRRGAAGLPRPRAARPGARDRPQARRRDRAAACEAKIDGLSISLRYEDGVFVQWRHARRRHDRRGRHRQPQDHQGHPAQAERQGRPEVARRARRGLYGAQGVPGD